MLNNLFNRFKKDSDEIAKKKSDELEKNIESARNNIQSIVKNAQQEIKQESENLEKEIENAKKRLSETFQAADNEIKHEIEKLKNNPPAENSESSEKTNNEATEAEEKELSPEEKKQQIIRQRNERRKQTIMANIEKGLAIASDKSAYEDLGCEIFDNCSMFKARRIGGSHIKNQTPCQDFCDYKKTDDIIILVCADGVGSCKYSHIGSEALTKTVIKTIETLYQGAKNKYSEKEFFDFLSRRELRIQITSSFKKEIKKDIEKKAANGIAATIDNYASNLAFAVVSSNYCFAASVGDCQIMLFNNDFGIKHRLHKSKEIDNQKTASIVDDNCVDECFVIDLYDMRDYTGVLLTTDGIYDYLQSTDMFFDFCVQAKERFLEHKEPYMPFCFTDKREDFGLFDVGYRGIKRDDVSLAAAFFNREPDSSSRIAAIKEQFPINYAIKHSEDISWFKIKKDSKEADLFCFEDSSKSDLKLKNASYLKPDETVKIKNQAFFKYYSAENYSSLEELFSEGTFKLRHCQGENALAIGRIIKSINDLSEELRDKGYAFSENAKWLIWFDENNNVFYLPRAFTKSKKSVEAPQSLKRYLIGYTGYYHLKKQEKSIPIIAVNSSAIYKEIGNDKDFFEISELDGKRYIKNISDNTWVIDNKKLMPNETIEFFDKLTICTQNENETSEHCLRRIRL